MEDLRKTMLADAEVLSTRRRFGLFSQPAPLAIGDNSPYKKPTSRRAENGKPVTQPPQMLGGSCKTGHTRSSYFQTPSSIYQHDPYRDQSKLQVSHERKPGSSPKLHEHQFKPASGEKVLDRAAYKYVEQNPEAKKPSRLDETGKVRTQSRNITTNPPSKIATELFRHSRHISDPYDHKKKLQQLEHQEGKKKMPESAFKATSRGGSSFGKIKEIFGLDDKAKQVMASRMQRSKSSINIYPHESVFKPAAKTSRDPINKYPASLELLKTAEQISPRELVEARRQKVSAGREKWVPVSTEVSRPTPSISLSLRNLGLRR